MNAVVLAGDSCGPENLLFNYTQGKPKALVDVAGKPMAQWVLDALAGAESVEEVLVVGLEAKCGLTCSKPLHFLPYNGSMLENIKSGIQHTSQLNPKACHTLIVSCDIPAITPEIVDWRVNTALEYDADIDYVVVERRTMEKRFPGANRSYVRLKDVELCGGDINVARIALLEHEHLWLQIIAARKNAFKQAALIGIDVLLLLLLKRISLQDAEHRVSKRLGVKGRACISPYAEVAMDVDKPHQLELMRSDLAS
jgi:GTP:adenosylcobinamide-phosphate guanylyltransferase